MSAPKRIQRTRQPGFRMPEGTIYVGRPTRWGNPFVVGLTYNINTPTIHRHNVLVEDRAHAVRLYVESLITLPHVDAIRAELGGHDLACWCPLTSDCHADVLLELANPPEGETLT